MLKLVTWAEEKERKEEEATSPPSPVVFEGGGGKNLESRPSHQKVDSLNLIAEYLKKAGPLGWVIPYPSSLWQWGKFTQPITILFEALCINGCLNYE